MRPHTLRRRGRFYHRKRSHWRLNLALVLLGAMLAGFAVVDMRAGSPPPGPAEDTAERIAAPAPTTPTNPAEVGSTTLASTASAPILAPPRPRRSGGSLAAGLAPSRGAHGGIRANRRDFDGAGARLDASAVPRTLVPVVMHSPTQPEPCKTCGGDVPF